MISLWASGHLAEVRVSSCWVSPGPSVGAPEQTEAWSLTVKYLPCSRPLGPVQILQREKRQDDSSSP